MKLIRAAFADKNIWKETRAIFWFSTLTSLISALNLFSDEFISGNLGKDVISAIGTVSLNLPLIMSITFFLKTSTKGHIAQSITTGKNDHAQKSFDFSLILSLVMVIISGLLMWALQKPLIDWRILGIANHLDGLHVKSLANQYYWFQIGSVLIMFFSNRYDLFFVIKGYQGRLTFVTLVSIATNVVVSSLLAYTAGLGIIGLGIGTLSSVVMAMFVKLTMMYSIRKQFDIKLSPMRFLKAKFSQIKILRKTWLYLPYEFAFASLVVGQSFVLTNMFNEGLALISMSGGIVYAIIGANGAAPIMVKFVSPLLGHGKVDEAREMTQKILVVSTVRQFFVSLVFVSIFGFALPYIHLYKVPHEMLVHTGYIVVGAGMVAGIMAPSFFTGYNLAGLSANPKLLSIVDLSSTAFSLLIYFIAALISTSWVSIMVAMIIHRIIADTSMVSMIFMKSQYKSLKKEMA